MSTAKDPFDDFTVIIPVLNESQGIEFLLKSIVSLYSGIWCFVVDDGSTDGTQEIVKRFGKVHSRVLPA